MPRTKIPKKRKLDREAEKREEKVREFEANLEDGLNQLQRKGESYIDSLNDQLRMLIQRAPKALLRMTMGALLELQLAHFADWTPGMAAINCRDEGYSTGSSNAMGNTTSTVQPSGHQLLQQERTPGPLSMTRRFGIRSKRFAPTATPNPNTPTRIPRLKLRTPIPSASSGLSADRPKQAGIPSPTAAFMRWPRLGEQVVSMKGSPIMAHVLPSTYANVNIPVSNGVISLQPKKITDVKPELIKDIDKETLKQVQILQANLQLIVNTAKLAQ